MMPFALFVASCLFVGAPGPAPSDDGPTVRPATPPAVPAQVAPEPKAAVTAKAARKKTAAPGGKAKPATAFAETSPEAAVALAKAIEARYAKAKTFSADFIQRYTRVALSRTSENRGRLVVKKPGKFRFDYTKPDEKLWIWNGKDLLVYDPEFEQLYVDANVSNEDVASAMLFLTGEGELRNEFAIRRLPRGDLGINRSLALLELTPNRDTAYRRVVLAAMPNTGEVKETWLFNTSGDVNRWIFTNSVNDRRVPDARFEFTPPPGTEIIER